LGDHICTEIIKSRLIRFSLFSCAFLNKNKSQNHVSFFSSIFLKMIQNDVVLTSVKLKSLIFFFFFPFLIQPFFLHYFLCGKDEIKIPSQMPPNPLFLIPYVTPPPPFMFLLVLQGCLPVPSLIEFLFLFIYVFMICFCFLFSKFCYCCFLIFHSLFVLSGSYLFFFQISKS